MQQIARSVALALNTLPRPHRFMLGSLTAMTLAVALCQPLISHQEDDRQAVIRQIEVQGIPHFTDSDATEPDDQTTPLPDEDLSADQKDVESVQYAKEYTVAAGDTLSSILNQYGIDLSNINALVGSDGALRNLNIGQSLNWQVNAEGELDTLDWEISRRETRHYVRRPNGTYSMEKRLQQGEWQDQTLKGIVQGSFANSAQRAGLSSNEIASVIKALQWQMDFRKLRSGDKFSAIFSREVLQGKRMQSQLQAVRVRSGGKDYYAFRAQDGKFYDQYASGLAKGFLRYPTVKTFRVSSNFNPRRVNPVTGRITPHRGVDFAVPIGTPVLAVGDGEVVVANNIEGAAGKYVAIRHGRQYTTRYMHLSRLLVKPGQKVKRGDRIALSGNTGRSTGPHLHFEIWINNQAVNPLTAKLPRMEGLAGKERKDYLAQVKIWQGQLTF
ncbi:murein DD-endopeptidase MepM [Rosenbergiella australiborealis]|uniref:Murein DD-endopeptidase MepM n=1 Tax=Rosenbergiella australiborealis TaxID=1544696 RepID=A0ABS5T7G6_9GAMM|nr:murein DD-endopeptidase MepM [Rosenbergiella australiborealis]